MKYKLIQSSTNDTNNIIKTTLFNRGIENWEEYLNLNSIDSYEYESLDNIKEAIECFVANMERGSEVGILFDTDTDGICSGTIMYKYIKNIEPDCKVHIIIHEKQKAHGLSSKDFVIPDGVKLLIIPDSSTNDIDECQDLIDRGVDVIILDHHVKNDEKVNPAIVINNQMSDEYENKEACGAHITYNFCQALEEYRYPWTTDGLEDLVSLANVADVMDIRSFPTRAMINYGLASIQNKMFKEILKAQEFSTKGVVSPFTVAFYVSPLINAFLRCATFDERVLLARAFCEDESETFEYTKRGEDFPTEENIYEHVVRLMKSYKSKQDRVRQKALPQIVKMANGSNDKVAIIDVSTVLENALTGVVAIRVSEELNKPVLLLQRRNDDIFGGSARCFDNCEIEDFRLLIDSCPHTTFASGHPSAFGIEIPVKNIEATRQWLNEKLADVSMEKVYEVDFEVDADELDQRWFYTLHEYQTLWGHGVDEPTFAIKRLHITSDNARVCGKKLDTIQIYDDEADVKYVMFMCKENNKLLQWINNNWGDQEAYIDVVGTLELSYYEGKFSNQVRIEDFQIVETIQN